jgi:hypothetical protein
MSKEERIIIVFSAFMLLLTGLALMVLHDVSHPHSRIETMEDRRP